MSMPLTIGGIGDVFIAEGQHRTRYEPIGGGAIRTYDRVLHSQVTTQRGYRRIWGPLQTPEMPIADARALLAELETAGAREVDGGLVASSVLCQPRKPALVYSDTTLEAAVSFELAAAGAVAADRQELLRLQVADSDGVFHDRSEWLIRANVSEHIDQFCATAELTLLREDALGTMAPGMYDDPPIDGGRQFKLDSAILALGDTVTDGDWQPEIHGYIDESGWGGTERLLTLPCRDLGALFVDTMVIDRKTYGTADALTPIQTIMQQVTNDNLDDPPSILVIGNPDFGVTQFEAPEASLLQIIQSLILNGWDFRYRWHAASGMYRPTFYEPDREQAVPDHTFGEGDYFELTNVSKSTRDVRTKVRVYWREKSFVEGESVEGKAALGGRHKTMVLDEINNDQISTAPQALAFVDNVLKDTALARLNHTAENALVSSRVEINQLCRYTANGIHYKDDQDVAVQGFTKSFTPEGNSISIIGRGKAAASTIKYLQKEEITRRKREIEPLDPLELPEEDVLLLYTTASGTQGYSAESSGPESLGGYISTTELSSVLSEIFREVEDAERAAGITLYRSIAFINKNAFAVPEPFQCVRVWLSKQGEDGITWSLALDPEGIVDYDREAIQSAISANETTAPATTPALTWVEPTAIDHADALDVGTVESGFGIVIHVRLVVAAGATGQITDERIMIRNRVPFEAAA